MKDRKFRDLESGYMGSAAQIKMKMKLAVSGATALLLHAVRNFTNENEIQQYEPPTHPRARTLRVRSRG